MRTISCRLIVAPDQEKALAQTLVAFAGACNDVAGVRQRTGTGHRFALHKLCYADIRRQFGLSANLAVQAIARVAAAKTGQCFAVSSVGYDARTFSFRERDWTFSLNTVAGRIRLNTLLGEFQRRHLTGQSPTSATLVCRRGRYFLQVQVKSVAPPVATVNDFLGVDLGLAQIATDSTGAAFTGEPVERLRRRRTIARKQYQRAGTKSAKRRLRRMAGRQSRYQKHINHVVSKTLVAKAKALGVGLALENLSGLRTRTQPTARRRLRERLGNWGFFQLRTFVEYKARREGIPVVLVQPAYSSQTCSDCGHCERGNRRTQSEFVCRHCGLSLNADHNAARNIRAWAVRKPAPKVSAAFSQEQSPRL